MKLAGKAAFFSKAKIFGCNSAVVHPKKEYLPPSCSSRDFASDEIVFIMQSLNLAARMRKTAKDLKTSSNPVL